MTGEGSEEGHKVAGRGRVRKWGRVGKWQRKGQKVVG